MKTILLIAILALVFGCSNFYEPDVECYPFIRTIYYLDNNRNVVVNMTEVDTFVSCRPDTVDCEDLKIHRRISIDK